MHPQDFFSSVQDLAREFSFPENRLMLGGDHLGPNPWKDLSAQEAMAEADAMVRAYVRAGYKKIHLDPSMPCKGEGHALSPSLIAERAAALCKAAEEVQNELGVSEDARCVYIVGTEVPTPGGIREHEELHITEAADVQDMIHTTKKAFAAQGVQHAWKRVCAVVVQPGVEFGDASIIRYQAQKAAALSAFVETPESETAVYEAHSTDYQSPRALAELVRDHFAILKVGPALTFALREALMALDCIEQEAARAGLIATPSHFTRTVSDYVKAHPKYWKQYYSGSKQEIDYAILFSLSDRIRYYWNEEAPARAADALMRNLRTANIPYGLISQYAPYYPLDEAFDPERLVRENILRAAAPYYDACAPPPTKSP